MKKWLTEREDLPEIMDDLSLSGRPLRDTLQSLERVNRWLGGCRVVVSGLAPRLKDMANEQGRPLQIADLGCGSGDTLRALARFCRSQGLQVQLFGFDANPETLEFARERSRSYPEITFRPWRLPEDPIPEGMDVFICSLFLHHFPEREVLHLLSGMRASSVRLILLNDLQRHWLPYLLFSGWSRIFGLSYIARHDGLISIRRSFRRRELEGYLKQCHFPDYSLRWRWAFRWQVLIFNHNHGSTA